MATVQQVDPGTQRYTQYIIYELAQSIRERDIITYEHCRRVAIYVNRLARHMDWSRRTAHDLALAGLVHDLGKTWIQNAVLHKASALSSTERAQMERHPAIAARMLDAYGVSECIISYVLHHHETYNGNGYPDHLAGEYIPLGARLLTVADVFDVLTSDRSYKRAMDISAARECIAVSSGTHFDPEVVAAFLDLLNTHTDFLIPARLSPLPVREAPHPTWVRHDVFDEW